MWTHRCKPHILGHHSLKNSSHHVFEFRGKEERTGAREQLLSHSQGRYCSQCFCPSNPDEVFHNKALGLNPGRSTFEVFRKIKYQPKASSLSSTINMLSCLSPIPAKTQLSSETEQVG